METYSFKNIMLAAILTASSPLELVKSRIQVMPQLISTGKINYHYKGISDCIKNVVSKQGFQALWKGSSIGVLRFFPNQNINFTVKNFVKQYLPSGLIYNALSGITGGITAMSILFPFDTLRVHLSNSTQKVNSLFKEALRIKNQQGLMFFYHGFFNSLIGVAIFRGISFGTYDTLKSKSEQTLHKVLSAYASSVLASLSVYPLDTIRRKSLALGCKNSQIQTGKSVIQKQGLMGLFRGSKIVLLQSLIGSIILLSFDKMQGSKTITNF